VIYRPIRPAAPRAQGRVWAGREFFARYLRRFARFLAARARARLRGEEESMRLVISLIPNYSGSHSDFSAVGDLFSSSLRRAWARALKNSANRLSRRAKTRAQLMPTLGRELHA
jgi:hypothetical protein